MLTRISQKNNFLQNGSKMQFEIILLLLAWKKRETFLFHRRLMCSQKEESAYIWIILHKQKTDFVSQWLFLFDK